MDLATIIGIIVGFGLIIGSILLDGSLGSFINVPGLLIVVGGTFAAALIAQKLPVVLGAFKVALNAFFDKTRSVEETTKTLMELADKVRKEDLLALESVNVEDPFMAKGVRMAVDGVPVEVIATTLTSELVAMRQRHQTGQKVFRFMAATAPSMGMIGTLIGLVNMLQALDDPSSIGPAMAVALLTTLYGAVMAFLIFGPVADKLEARTSLETASMRLTVSGLESIVKGDNALILKEKLEAYLSPSQRQQEAA